MKAICPRCGKRSDCAHGDPKDYECSVCGHALAEHRTAEGAPELGSLQGVEVLKEGDWPTAAGGVQHYDGRDLDRMVDNFNRVLDRVPLVVREEGKHGKPAVTLPGAPALGWVTSLRHVGHSLVADFDAVPKAIWEMITNGALRQRSSEIALDLKYPDGVAKGKALLSVMFFGQGIPGVQGLADVASLYAVDIPNRIEAVTSDLEHSSGDSEKARGDAAQPGNRQSEKVPSKPTRSNHTMDPEKVLEQLRLLYEAQIAGLKKELDSAMKRIEVAEHALTETKTVLTKTETDLSAFRDREKTARRQEAEQAFHKLVTEGKLQPSSEIATVEHAMSMADEDRKAYLGRLTSLPSVFERKELDAGDKKAEHKIPEDGEKELSPMEQAKAEFERRQAAKKAGQ